MKTATNQIELLNATYSVRTAAGYEVNLVLNRNGSCDIKTMQMQKPFNFTESDPVTVKGVAEALLLAAETAIKHKDDFTPLDDLDDL